MNRQELIRSFLKAGNALREELSGRVIIHRTPQEVADVIFGRDMSEPQREEADALRKAFLKPSCRQRLSNAIPGTYTGSWNELSDAYATLSGQGLSPLSNPMSKIAAELVTLGLTNKNALTLMHGIGYMTGYMNRHDEDSYLEGLEKLQRLQTIRPELFEAAIPENIAWQFHAEQAMTHTNE